MSITKIFAAGLICAASVTAVFAQYYVDPCTHTAKLSATAAGAQEFTGNSNGNKSLAGTDYGYEMWTEGGNNNKLIWFGPDQGGGAAFRTEWNNPNDYLGRVGYFMNQGKAWTQYKNMYCEYNYTRSANGTGGGYSYIGLYGWTKNPQIEWYIVEDWFGSGIFNNAGILGTKKGEFTASNGATYHIWRNTRPAGSGNILNDGQAFPQYFSVRQRDNSGTTTATNTCGTIYVNEHFAEFEKISDMKMGTDLYEVKFLVEAGGGTGWFEATYLKLTQEDVERGSVSPGNFSLVTYTSPANGGEVTKSSAPAGGYAPGASVTLTAAAKDGWKFAEWTGDHTGKTNPAEITMNANKSITARFEPTGEGNNIIKSGDFPSSSIIGASDKKEDPAYHWILGQGNNWGNSNASTTVSSNSVEIIINTIGAQSYQPQLVQYGVPLENGMKYKLTFTAKAAAARKIVASFQKATDPWTDYAVDSFSLTTSNADYEMVFTMSAASDPAAQFAFNVGQTTDNVTISNVKLVYAVTSSIGDMKIPQANVKKSSLRVTAKKSAINVKFKAKSIGTTELRLYGLKGNLVSKTNLQTVSGKSYSHTFDAGKIPNGFYVVSVQSNGSIDRSKVVMPK